MSTSTEESVTSAVPSPTVANIGRVRDGKKGQQLVHNDTSDMDEGQDKNNVTGAGSQLIIPQPYFHYLQLQQELLQQQQQSKQLQDLSVASLGVNKVKSKSKYSVNSILYL